MKVFDAVIGLMLLGMVAGVALSEYMPNRFLICCVFADLALRRLGLYGDEAR